MAARYSGNVELRIALKKMRGDSGEMGWFYVAKIAMPGHHAEGVLSPREVGVRTTDLASPEAYDSVARAMLDLGNEETGGLVGREAVRKRGGWEILRVQQSPCPVEGHVARRRSPARRVRSRRDPSTCEVSAPGHQLIAVERGCFEPAYDVEEIEPLFGDEVRIVKSGVSREEAEVCAGSGSSRDPRRRRRR